MKVSAVCVGELLVLFEDGNFLGAGGRYRKEQSGECCVCERKTEWIRERGMREKGEEEEDEEERREIEGEHKGK